ncbi:complex I intermediate-associated protein 30-domain-containing protein [Aspergillus aurantiobrunneus]
MDCTEHIVDRRVLFGGGSTWYGNWRATSTDEVRGLAYVAVDHHSHLGQTEFHGWLNRARSRDKSFASLQSVGNDNEWDLSGFNALELVLGKSDGKQYTILLEDNRPVSWEANFRHINDKGLTVPVSRVIRFNRLWPTSRVSQLASLPQPIDLRNIKKCEIQCRNINEEQEGAFSLSLYSINAVRLSCTCPPVAEPDVHPQTPAAPGMWQRMKSRIENTAANMWLMKPKRKPD